jgi:WD40 repeat protein
VPAPLRGLSLARERDWLLARDGRDGLFLFNHAGAIQAQRPSPLPATAICSADDGSAYAIGAEAAVCWLAPDLAPRWQRPLPARATAIALEPLGRRLAVADAACTLHLFDSRGQTLWRATTPRPLVHLTFVPEKAIVVGAADFGLVVCFGTMGECLWLDGLVAHVGSLAVSGDGDNLVLACFSDGLYRYNTAGQRLQRMSLETACHLAALSYAGDCLLTAGRDERVCLRQRDGSLRDQISLENPVVALALGALGDYGVVGLAGGILRRIDTRQEGGADRHPEKM